MIDKENDCPICKRKTLDDLRNDLSKCKKSNQAKDRKLKEFDKKMKIYTLIGVAIAAIFGKEALDTITEWLTSVQDFGSASSDLFSVHPSPGVLPVLAMGYLFTGVRRRK